MEKRSLPLLKPLSETMKVDLRQIEEKLEDHEMESERDQRDEFNFDLPEFRKSDFTYKVESKNLSQSANFSRNISLKTKTTSDFKVFQQRSQYKSPPPRTISHQ